MQKLQHKFHKFPANVKQRRANQQSNNIPSVLEEIILFLRYHLGQKINCRYSQRSKKGETI
jgi:hypothetical protein